ncbi:N-formylglutamate amidohydrolase [Christiangramia sp.]|uniref:N-formylglutamate amidohydrolase n=1 Tax=Christiangramia sp. TaxID=1931228 RepID=UPI002620912D|nr:N-formylglutamate amidohydrolase [Christiangramia sp.]
MKLVLTCEHAFPDIPEKYQYLFMQEAEILETHEAYDTGAFDLFNHLKVLADYSKYQKIGRLLIETNRSEHHQKLFSRYSEHLPEQDRNMLLQSFYRPYRDEIIKKIEAFIQNGNSVLHISVHTFTPILNDIERNCDIGFLYDPKRKAEKKFCRKWKRSILTENQDLKIRYNYPYLGTADGFTTTLRKIFLKNYLGIEIEVNQKLVSRNELDAHIRSLVVESLKKIIETDYA